MFSHSSARAICDVARNVPDDVLHTVAVNGGICMVTMVADLVSPTVAEWHQECEQLLVARGEDPHRSGAVASIIRERSATESVPKATVADVVAHLEHVRAVAGIDHIGIGGDFDGATLMPVGLDDVSGYPRLWDALRARRWSDSDVARVATGNVLRVLRDAELVSEVSPRG